MRKEDQDMNRRTFTSNMARGAVGMAVAGGPLASRILGANDRIRMGFIGVGEMGTADLKDHMRTGQIDVVAIADPYQPHLDAALALTNGQAKGFKDFRRVLDMKDIDAVTVAVPDHWHAIPMIMACQSGKDVYVEKPLSHTLEEGRKMCEAAAKYKRVVQVGTQQRSGTHFQEAVQLVRSGRIGKVTNIDTWIYWNQPAEWLGNPPDCDPPSTLDWDLWLGPAPYHAYNPNRCIANFRWFWDYANGMLTDWGAHLIDVAHWAMGVDAPKTVSFSGGKYAVETNTETPDTFEALWEYPASPVSGKEFLVNFRCRFTNGYTPDGRGAGTQFYGTDGTLMVDRGGYALYPKNYRPGKTPESEIIRGGTSDQHFPHVQNFLDCVRTRQKTHSDVETVHRVTSACLTAVIAGKLGRKLKWDAQAERFIGDKEANAMLTKEYRKPWKLS
jgi:predicted dehydrogenase